MLFVAFKMKGIVQKTTNKAQPVIAKAEDAIGAVNGMVHNVQSRVERVASTAEDTVEAVSRKVKGTTEVVTQTAASPLITVSSVITGLSRGLEIYGHLQRRRGGTRRAA
jgi:phage-related protein